LPEIIYREYSAKALWSQYNNRSRVDPKWRSALKEQRAQRSAAVRGSGIRQFHDIRFGPHERERLDLFMPEIHGAPLHVFIHGGYWQKNAKEDFSFVSEAFVPAGVAVAVIEYALCPEVTLAELTDQVRRAIKYLWQAAKKYGYDRNNIQVCGHSAGGHLTAMMLATDWMTFSSELPPGLIGSGLPISGIYDLEPIRLTPLNDATGLSAADIAPLSPIYLDPAVQMPLVVVVGEAESPEFYRQASDFTKVWKACGMNVKLLTVAGLNHFSILDQLTDPSSELFRTALRLMGRS
jgi:arylformamidase